MKYWVFKDSRIVGPLAAEDMAQVGGLRPETLVSVGEIPGEREADWRCAEEIPELAVSCRSDVAGAFAEDTGAGRYDYFFESGASEGEEEERSQGAAFYEFLQQSPLTQPVSDSLQEAARLEEINQAQTKAREMKAQVDLLSARVRELEAQQEELLRQLSGRTFIPGPGGQYVPMYPVVPPAAPPVSATTAVPVVPAAQAPAATDAFPKGAADARPPASTAPAAPIEPAVAAAPAPSGPQGPAGTGERGESAPAAPVEREAAAPDSTSFTAAMESLAALTAPPPETTPSAAAYASPEGAADAWPPALTAPAEVAPADATLTQGLSLAAEIAALGVISEAGSPAASAPVKEIEAPAAQEPPPAAAPAPAPPEATEPAPAAGPEKRRSLFADVSTAPSPATGLKFKGVKTFKKASKTPAPAEAAPAAAPAASAPPTVMAPPASIPPQTVVAPPAPLAFPAAGAGPAASMPPAIAVPEAGGLSSVLSTSPPSLDTSPFPALPVLGAGLPVKSESEEKLEIAPLPSVPLKGDPSAPPVMPALQGAPEYVEKPFSFPAAFGGPSTVSAVPTPAPTVSSPKEEPKSVLEPPPIPIPEMPSFGKTGPAPAEPASLCYPPEMPVLGGGQPPPTRASSPADIPVLGEAPLSLKGAPPLTMVRGLGASAPGSGEASGMPALGAASAANAPFTPGGEMPGPSIPWAGSSVPPAAMGYSPTAAGPGDAGAGEGGSGLPSAPLPMPTPPPEAITGGREILSRLAKPPESPTTAPKPKPRRPTWMYAAGGASVLGVVIGIWIMFFQNPKDLRMMFKAGKGDVPVEAEDGDEKGPMSATPEPSLGGTQPKPRVSGGPSVGVGPDGIPDPNRPAIDFTKSYPLEGGRGTIGQWLQYAFSATPGDGSKEEWSAGAVEASTYLVQYKFAPGPANAGPREPVSYLFETDLAKKTVVGKNPPAKDLLAGKDQGRKAKQPKKAAPPAAKRPAAKRPAAPPIPLDEDLLPPSDEGSSMPSEMVDPGL